MYLNQWERCIIAKNIAYISWWSFKQNRWKGNLSHANRLPRPFLSDSSGLDGAQHTLQQFTVLSLSDPFHLSPEPPPTLTTVQQLDPQGALLASTPTHSTPWCQNTEHSGIAQTALSWANRQKLLKAHSSAVRSPPACQPASQAACAITKCHQMGHSHTKTSSSLLLSQ